MKKFSEQIDERLKLNKDTKIYSLNNININDLEIDKEYKCVSINLNSYEISNNQSVFDWIPSNKPKQCVKDTYKIHFNWKGYIYRCYSCYTVLRISAPFLWFINEYNNPMYVILNNEEDMIYFIKNYDKMYKDIVINIDKQYIKEVRK